MFVKKIGTALIAVLALAGSAAAQGGGGGGGGGGGQGGGAGQGGGQEGSQPADQGGQSGQGATDRGGGNVKGGEKWQVRSVDFDAKEVTLVRLGEGGAASSSGASSEIEQQAGSDELTLTFDEVDRHLDGAMGMGESAAKLKDGQEITLLRGTDGSIEDIVVDKKAKKGTGPKGPARGEDEAKKNPTP